MTTSRVNDHTINIISWDDNISIWIDTFLQSKKAEGLSKYSIKFYANSLRLFATYCETQSAININQITPQLLRNFILYLESKKHNTGGINVFFRSIKAWLNWYENETELEDWINPIRKVKPPKIIEKQLPVVTKEQFSELIKACTNDRDIAILYLMFDCGARANEICNIKIEHVNFIDNSILIEKGKGGKMRFSGFGNKTRRKLRKYLHSRRVKSTYLFVNRYGEKLKYWTLREILERLCSRSGVQGISLHSFRRAYATESLRMDVDNLSLSRLLGHSNQSLLPRYAKQTNYDLINKYKSPLDDEE